MIKEFQSGRLTLLACLLVGAFCALGFRLADLQVRQHAELTSEAEDNTKRSALRAPRRGEILDIQGNPMAASVFVKTVCADPTLIGDYHVDTARILAPLLQMRESELAEKLRPRILRYATNGDPVFNQYVVLKRKVRNETWERIRSAMTNVASHVPVKELPRKERRFYYNLRHAAVFADRREDQLRVYPNGGLAAHVLGYVRTDEDRTSLETRGQYGVESEFDRYLDGTKGFREYERDSRGNELVTYRRADYEPTPGMNVVLTIDSGLQYIVETELIEAWKKHTPLSVSAVAVRPKTGEILAMATLPNFDPHHPGDFQLDTLRNRIVADSYEPGSTFKIVVVAGALNDGTVTLNDRFDCEQGLFRYKGVNLHDHHGYGMLSVEEIITKSSNIGSAKIGLKMGGARLQKYIRDFGFGTRSGIQLPGEIAGIVNPMKKWSGISITRIPMGHEIGVTALQLVMAMSAIANDGKLMKPMLIDRIENSDGEVVPPYFFPTEIRQTISPKTAKLMVQALKTVPRKGGTAPQAALELHTVAGKTGTAQKPVLVNGKYRYVKGKYFASFCGFFPADDPEICILVVFDEPKNGYYGGTVAGPVFQRIARRAAKYMNIPPEPELLERLELTGLKNAPLTARRN